MHLFVITLLLAVVLFGITANDAYACGCNNSNNSITVESETTNNNINNNSNQNDTNNANSNTNANYNNSAAQATSSANAQSTSGAIADAAGGGSAAQGGSASTSTSVSTGGDDTPASSAAPVALTSSNDTCMGSSGVGGQGMTFGFSVGTTWTDKNCVMLKNAREMKNQGHDKAAKIRLCMDEDNAIAFAAAGAPCPRALKTAQNAAAMMKDARMAALAPVADTARAGDVKDATAAAKDSDSAAAVIPPAALAAFMLDSGNKVFFDLDKADLKPKERKTLDKQATWLTENEDVRILVEGHADERGTREYNLALGDRRANAVKKYLIAKGVGADRIETISFGEERPAVAESNEAAWSQNRRAVTQIIPPKPEGGKTSSLPGELVGNQMAALDYHSIVPATADVTEGPE